MQSKPTSVEQYLAALPEDRRVAIAAVRATILKNLDKEYQETLQYGMLGYSVPHSVYPAGYHSDPRQPLPFAALASQKGHMSLYMMGLYCGCSDGDGDNEQTRWFKESWLRTGKKLDMGKACIRFKRLEDVPLEVIGEAIRRIPARTYIARYEEVLKQSKGAGAATKKAATATKTSAAATKKPAAATKKAAATTKKPAAGRK
ncbi:MAG: DUF1801 domain-containing protein [Polyangia bacterium]